MNDNAKNIDKLFRDLNPIFNDLINLKIKEILPPIRGDYPTSHKGHLTQESIDKMKTKVLKDFKKLLFRRD